jgi:ABC-type sugar transport system ATPase subunit
VAKIVLENVSRAYKAGEVQALDKVSFECPEGKFFCLLGPAGAGKTTTVKLIAGIEPVDGGRILFNEEDVTDMLPMERDVAVAFETYALYPQRTVRENMEFPLQAPSRKSNWNNDQIESRVVEIAELLGIGELLDRFPRQLSGGQRQRVALGRALVRRPRAYLLDEPIAHLDAKLRHRMRGELKRIQKEMGITTFYTTPDQLEALSLADVISVINEGKVEQIGPPFEIYKRPGNIFVGRFVGDPPMNIFEAQLQEDTLNIEGSLSMPVDAASRGTLAEQISGRRVYLGVRPKDIQILETDAQETSVQAEVMHVQVLGETSVVTLNSNGAEIRVKVSTQNSPNRGENVRLSFTLGDCHFFDLETETRLKGLA